MLINKGKVKFSDLVNQKGEEIQGIPLYRKTEANESVIKEHVEGRKKIDVIICRNKYIDKFYNRYKSGLYYVYDNM